MTGLWRNLFRDNPMQIEALRAARRFTSSSGKNAAIQKTLARVIGTLLTLMYFWLLIMIAVYREDVSQELLWFEFILLTLIVPGSLYGAISGERERLTWDSLILTNLSPARILVGKLAWRLLMAAGVMSLFITPLLLTHFLARFKMVHTLEGLLWSQACLAGWSVLLAAFTLWMSARTKRSVTTLAVVLGWLIAFLILCPALLMLFGGDVYQMISNSRQDWSHEAENLPALFHVGAVLLHLNPAYACATLNFKLDPYQSSEYLNVVRDWRSIQMASPVIYLLLAGGCIVGTLRELGRLGLPTGEKGGRR